jgi:hypothetical protein
MSNALPYTRRVLLGRLASGTGVMATFLLPGSLSAAGGHAEKPGRASSGRPRRTHARLL